MSADAFIDTNVFVYLFDEADDEKRRRAETIVYRALADGTGCISFQVVQEALNVVIRKLDATPADARRLLDDVLIPCGALTRAHRSTGAALTSRFVTDSLSTTA